MMVERRLKLNRASGDRSITRLAVTGPGAEPVQKFLARVGGIGLMFGLRSTRNTRVDGHVSAHGMPNGARVVAAACGPPHASPHADLALIMMPSWGLGLVSTVGFRPQHGTVDFRRNSRWPQRGKAWGNAPGPTTGRSPPDNQLLLWW